MEARDDESVQSAQVEVTEFLPPVDRKHSRFRICALLTLVALIAALVGAALALQVHGKQEHQQLPPAQSTRSSSISLHPSRASEVLGELSVEEVQAISKWFCKQTGVSPWRSKPSIKKWLAGPSAVELLRPSKAETVAYLDEKGPKPARHARVTVVDQWSVIEYKVGPIEGGAPVADAAITELVPASSIPYSKRPGMLVEFGFVMPIFDAVVLELGSLLIKAFGPVWPNLPGFQPEKGRVTCLPRNDGLAPSGKRWTKCKSAFSPPAPSRVDSNWLHPVPFEVEIDITSWNTSEWKVVSVGFCGQNFKSVASLKFSEKEGTLETCSADLSNAGGWDTPQVEGSQFGTRAEERDSGVSWGPWSLSVSQRPSTGIAVTDIRFKGERILYELALMDASATYAGSVDDQFMYSDTAFTMSQLSMSLKPGIDCPEDAKYVSAAQWMLPFPDGEDPTKATEFWPICIFEWVEDHTIWRHMDEGQVRGLLRRTLVVRSIATVGNYDYIMDIKFREDGEINVGTSFAGYPETRWPGEDEESYSTLVRPNVAGIVHTHGVVWKADIDVSGASNALRVSEVMERAADAEMSWKRWPTKFLTHRYVEKEGIASSTFVADAQKPKVWAIVNRNASATAGLPLNPRGYRVELMSFATTQVHSPDHPFTKAMPWSKYHLAVTKYDDAEYRPSDPYTNYDDASSVKAPYAQNLDRFLDDGDSLLDEDLVAWIGLSKEHIPRQEDIPLVSNFGVAFSLQPFNFYAGNIVSNPPTSEL